MTHTDLIARLRAKTAGRVQAYTSRHEPIPFAVYEGDYTRYVKDPDWDTAADALTAAQERIRVLTIALEHDAEGHPKDYTDNCDIARAALDAPTNT